MKKVNMLKKLLSFGLAVALFVTSPASVYALDAEGTSVESMADENVEEEKVATPEPISGEEKSDSDIQLEDEGKSVPSEDPADDELNTDSPRAGIADEDFVKEDEATQDDVEKAEEEATCEHSEFRYESNGDGTHKKICKDCDEVVAEKEPCEFDENGKCVLCGYVDPEHKFTLTDENGIVKVTGTKKVLNGATRVVAKEITADENKTELDKMADALDEEVAKESKSVVDFVAYDITLYNNNDKVTIQGDVNVVFTQLEVEGLAEDAYETEVYHYAEKTETVEQMKAEQISDDTVEMETSHFSTYLIAITGSSGKVLLSTSEYINVESVAGLGVDKAVGFGSSTPDISSVSQKQRTINISVHVDGKEFVYPSPNKVFKTGDSAKDRAILRITPKDGYKIDYVTGNEIYQTEDWKATTKPDGAKESDVQLEGFLRDVANSKLAKDIKIGIGESKKEKGQMKFVPATKVHIYLKKAEDIVTVNNARFVNIKKDRETPMATVINDKGAVENAFRFVTNGIENSASDKFYTDAIHEGMASDTIHGYSFRLNDNVFATQKKFFDNPLEVCVDSQEEWQHQGVVYPYDGAVYNAGIEFYKDGDYYTLDSDKKTYRLYDNSENKVTPSKLYDGGTLKIEKDDGQKFLPFGNDSSNRPEYNFGMIIPVKFSINENGMTGNNNTVFEFSGDDDVFVYIDGKLALDLGGIHNKVDGKIDFKTGDVTVTFNTYQPTISTQKNIYTDLKLADDVRSFSEKQHSLTFVYFERGSNQSNCKIKFNFDPEDIEVEEEGYTKDITVEKTWDDNNSPNRPSVVTFDVYGKYTEGNTTSYVTESGISQNKVAYNQIVVRKPANGGNVWKARKTGYPVFLNNVIEKVVTWEVIERPVTGYTVDYGDTIYTENVSVPSDVEPQIEDSAIGAQYSHIDIELWTANDVDQASNRLAGIKNYKGESDKISAFGWSDSYKDRDGYHSGWWYKTENDDIDVKKDPQTDEFSSRSMWKGSVFDSSKIAFRIRFADWAEDDYRLVILDKSMHYPKDTILSYPGSAGEDNYRRICDFVKGTTQYTQRRYYNGPYSNPVPESINIGEKNVFALSVASCGANPSQGIDFVLTPNTIDEFTVKEYTGNELHPVTNKKSSVNLVLSKKAVDFNSKGEQIDPDPDALYVFKIEQIEKDESGNVKKATGVKGTWDCTWVDSKGTKHSTSVSTDNDGYCSLYNTEEVFFNNLKAGDYRISETGIFKSNGDAPKYSLSDYDTRVLLNDKAVGETIKHTDTETEAETERSVVVNLANDKNTVKFENLKYTEKKETVPGKNQKHITKVYPDGTFDLTLDFTSPSVKVTPISIVANDKPQDTPTNQYDVVVVFDRSSSLTPQNNPAHLNEAKNAVKEMVNAIASKTNDDVDVRLKLVTFGQTAEVQTEQWVSKGTTPTYYNGFVSAVNAITVNNVQNGTNYEAAFSKAKDAFDNGKREGAKKVVVFVTDGAPNMYINSGNAGSTDPTYAGYEHALNAAGQLDCDAFYALGIALGNTRYTLRDDTKLTSAEILNNVANAVTKASTKKVVTADFGKIADELKGFAESIVSQYSYVEGQATTTYATNAVITDVFSEYAEFAETNVEYEYLVDGEKPKASDGYTFTPAYNSEIKTLDVTVSKANGDLGNHKYSVTFKIKPTAKAYEEFATNEDNYPTNMVGEEGTGASSYDETNKKGKPGFYSNASAQVKFTLNGKETTPLVYKKPVIQLTEVYDWQIVKLKTGTETPLAGAEFELTKDKTKYYYGLSQSDGTVSWFSDANHQTTTTIPAGTYELRETKAPVVDGLQYAKSNNVWTLKISTAAALEVNNEAVATTPRTVNGVTKKLATLKIENNVAYTLPETGGRGVYVYTIGGVLLMLGACLLLYKNKKNKNK